ncbi:hypothetical protein CHUAL_007891 [Chamberlinius hualienensis]
MAVTALLKVGQLLKTNLVRTNSSIVSLGIRKCCAQPLIDQQLNNKINVTITTRKNGVVTLEGLVGESLLDAVNRNLHLFDDFGVCNGTCACGTCLVVMTPEDYKKVPKSITDEEQDMIDLTEEPSQFARLGCQITLVEKMNGMTVEMTKKVLTELQL